MRLQVEGEVPEGTLVTLYGKSGAGKTSLLRMLAGLMRPEKGKIVVHGKTWLDTGKNFFLPPQKRRIGFVFQDYALFPNMSVRQNLSFALDKGQNPEIVETLIEVMELGELQDRKPDTLSGGQKQRVALARALVRKPALLMLDEPLSALDQELRQKLQQHLLELHRQMGLTTLLVSHDLTEILRLSDWVMVLEQGKIKEQGPPQAIFTERTHQHIHLQATVVSVQQLPAHAQLMLRTGTSVFQVQVESTWGERLKEGDEVMVSSPLIHPVIKKLTPKKD